ncbi:MAG: hypothetical protein AB8B97_17300 [Granulosicoccus sp.]
MHLQDRITEFTMASPLPRQALAWLYASIFFASLYVLRALIEEIPPLDRIALSFILCFLLIQTGFSLRQTRLRISLPHNRCWLRHHHLGQFKEQSLPVSQIHSAKLEFEELQGGTDTRSARIVLVTSLGMIPVDQGFSDKAKLLGLTCENINYFLNSQNEYLQA